MKPVKRAPTMWTVNGCGLTLYGSRDKDPETRTYVKTRCLSLVFLPLFALSAYRVAKAGGEGWYFLGRVPLSGFAKAWNFLIAICLAGGIGGITFNQIYNSPDAIAERKLAEAESQLSSGEVVAAAESIRSVCFGPSTKRDKAKELLENLHERA
ncbi:MAG: hypothetical protein AAFV88_01035, partial [Planctomycetota bacterium]